jgi:cell wall integrity and stress response component
LTGLVQDSDVDTYTGTITGTDGATTTGPSPSVVTQAGQTIVVTAGGSAKAGGPNKAGIAAGVVVAVIVIGAIVGGVFFFFKHKKRKAVEDEYRRNATISSFVAGGKSQPTGSMSDSRLDPSIMSHRRQSNGSIADDQDFSRRILKVTNPDGHY